MKFKLALAKIYISELLYYAQSTKLTKIWNEMKKKKRNLLSKLLMTAGNIQSRDAVIEHALLLLMAISISLFSPSQEKEKLLLRFSFHFSSNLFDIRNDLFANDFTNRIEMVCYLFSLERERKFCDSSSIVKMLINFFRLYYTQAWRRKNVLLLGQRIYE